MLKQCKFGMCTLLHVEFSYPILPSFMLISFDQPLRDKFLLFEWTHCRTHASCLFCKDTRLVPHVISLLMMSPSFITYLHSYAQCIYAHWQCCLSLDAYPVHVQSFATFLHVHHAESQVSYCMIHLELVSADKLIKNFSRLLN